MPGSRIPQPFYSPAEVAAFRLSSKSHWDVPVQIGKRTVHFLVSHPTPPVFDGPEDRNGLRNADEIRFWADYVTPGRGGYIYDDEGGRGGLRRRRRCSWWPATRTPIRSTATACATRPGTRSPSSRCSNSPRVNDTSTPSSAGAAEATRPAGRGQHRRTSATRSTTRRTSRTRAPGNLRADYVLPSRQIKIERLAPSSGRSARTRCRG